MICWHGIYTGTHKGRRGERSMEGIIYIYVLKRDKRWHQGSKDNSGLTKSKTELIRSPAGSQLPSGYRC